MDAFDFAEFLRVRRSDAEIAVDRYKSLQPRAARKSSSVASRIKHMHSESKRAAEAASEDGGPVPQELPDGTLVIAKYWGISKYQTLDFFNECQQSDGWSDQDSMSDFDRKFVAPICQDYSSLVGGRMGIALMINQDDPLKPTLFVSHAWVENIKQFAEDIDRHVLHDEIMYVCLLSNYQGTSEEISAQLGNDIHNAPFTQVLRSNACRRLLVVPNEELRANGQGLYSRLWCVWEIYTAANLRLPIDITDRNSEEHLFGSNKDGDGASCRTARCSMRADTEIIKAAIEMEEPASLKCYMLRVAFILICGMVGDTFGSVIGHGYFFKLLCFLVGIALGVACVLVCEPIWGLAKSAGLLHHLNFDPYLMIDGVIRGAAGGYYKVRRLRRRNYPLLCVSLILGCLIGQIAGSIMLKIHPFSDYSTLCGLCGAFNGAAMFVASKIDMQGTYCERVARRLALVFGSIALGGLTLYLSRASTCLTYVEGFLIGQTFGFVSIICMLQPLPFSLRLRMLCSTTCFGWLGWQVDGLCMFVICCPLGPAIGFAAAVQEWPCLHECLSLGLVMIGFSAVLVMNVSLTSWNGMCTHLHLLFPTG